MYENAMKSAFFKYLITMTVVAVLYSVTGFIGLSLIATSPGYATPIWIPSGIALGAMLIWGKPTLPGIFLGSLLLNYSVSANHFYDSNLIIPLFIGGVIAMGAVLQALAGWLLIKKWVGLSNPLNQPNAILLFAFLSGPISCLVNTTWSNTVLLLLNILPKEQYLFTWVTWWVGDSVGVLIFTPLFLILFAKPNAIWRQRIVPILIPLCISFLGVIMLYLIANASGVKEQLWSVLAAGLLFCVLINVILFIIHGQKSIVQMQMAEQALALKFEEAKNLLILRSAGEGIFGIDNDGNTTFVNPAAAKMLGFNESELIGKAIHDLVQYKNQDGSPYPRVKSPLHMTTKYNTTYHIRDEVFWRKNGTYFYVEYVITPLVDRGVTTGAVVVFNDVTQQRELEQKLARMAHYDALTGLPNRISFLEKLSSAIDTARSNQRMLAICFIDVDNFKQINDSLGHTVGDEILKFIPKLLELELTKTDYLARLGGDEFAVILENVISIDYIKLTLQRFIKVLNKPIKIENHEIMATLSIGIATYPTAGDTANELIKNADIAMYKAKEFGKNTFVFFDDEISKQVKRLNELESEMRKAFEREEFSTVYQPLIESESKQLLGFEVLTRWRAASLGNISPLEFIPMVEKNGLIHPIGEWTLRRACHDYHEIVSIFNNKEIFLSVNISVLQLENDKFLSTVKNILNDTGMNSNNIIFEITETELMQQPEHTIKLMDDFRKLGVRFALDDFGVNYSSMQYLKILPISLLKIDKTFIRDLTRNDNDVAIVKAIIQLAHGLGISTIAEGVETPGQYQLLKELGCEYIQGFYFAKPMPLQELILKQNDILRKI